MHHVALLNGRHYLYTDQLGSVGAISKNDGTLVGELLRYEPFGDARGTQPGSAITDRGFTGHRENRDIGLTYMNARYYVGEIGRFASADTLVPDPTDPQSFNRYAYALNSPLKYMDPSGHGICDADGNCQLREKPSLWNQIQRYDIAFTADDGEAWMQEQQRIALAGAADVDRALAETGPFTGARPGAAFRAVYGHITFHRSAETTWTDTNGVDHEIDYGAYTWGQRIDFYDPAFEANPLDPNFRYNVVHELGHAFNATAVARPGSGITPYDALGQALGSSLPAREIMRQGMAPYPWQQNTRDTRNMNSELFADGFLNWTYASFLNNQLGSQTLGWFDAQMSLWVAPANP